jgi:hypothetical protein
MPHTPSRVSKIGSNFLPVASTLVNAVRWG